VAAVALLVPAAAAAWTWPVEGPVLRPFVFDELTPEEPGQHRGISIGAVVGTPVRAPVDATITFAGTVPYGGKTLSLLSEQGLSVTLLHLGSFSVIRGATVREGQIVGSVGPSGDSELGDPFVYLGVRRVDDPEGYLDPLLFLPQPSVEPPPAAEPPPAPDPAPAPVAQPPVAVPPPPVTPLEPPTAQPTLPRLVAPTEGAPVRPVVPTSAWDVPVSPSPLSPPAATGQAVALDLPPVRRNTSATEAAVASETAPHASASPAAAISQPRADDLRAQGWLRPLDQLQATSSVKTGRSRSPAGAGRRPVELLGAILAALALLLLIGRRGGGGAARIIDGDALLPDNSDLLRECEPPHRARVHDDRRGRARPAPQAAR
jgi:hypothetical protein